MKVPSIILLDTTWLHFVRNTLLLRFSITVTETLQLGLYSLQKSCKVRILAVWNTWHTPLLSGICQIFSSKKCRAANSNTGLLSTKVFGTSWVLLQPFGDMVSISQTILSLLPSVHQSQSVTLQSWQTAHHSSDIRLESWYHDNSSSDTTSDYRLDVLWSQPVASPPSA